MGEWASVSTVSFCSWEEHIVECVPQFLCPLLSLPLSPNSQKRIESKTIRYSSFFLLLVSKWVCGSSKNNQNLLRRFTCYLCTQWWLQFYRSDHKVIINTNCGSNCFFQVQESRKRVLICCIMAPCTPGAVKATLHPNSTRHPENGIHGPEGVREYSVRLPGVNLISGLSCHGDQEACVSGCSGGKGVTLRIRIPTLHCYGVSESPLLNKQN